MGGRGRGDGGPEKEGVGRVRWRTGQRDTEARKGLETAPTGGDRGVLAAAEWGTLAWDWGNCFSAAPHRSPAWPAPKRLT